ncbi:MAG: hypothetical protein HYZ00_13035, partial [Candidatus Hydrogenedentes bacterium]|nr:hypothetical protein [Candidatus Hydrogenedentota bacterium]
MNSKCFHHRGRCRGACFAALSLYAAAIICIAQAAPAEITADDLKMQDLERARAIEQAAGQPEAAQKAAPNTKVLPTDADDDGMADSWEATYGLSAANPADAWLDPDNDRVVNLFEYQLGSSPSSAATPATVTVAPSGATYSSLATAIDSVAAGTCIRVAAGMHSVNYLTFSDKKVMIQGGWNSVFTSRDLSSNQTILDGGNTDEVLYFSISSGTPRVILDGLRFERGNGGFGTVVFITQGTASSKFSIVDCEFSNTSGDISVLTFANWDSGEADHTIANTMMVGNTGSAITSQTTNSAVARYRYISATVSAHTAFPLGSEGYGLWAFTLDSGIVDLRFSNSIFWGNTTRDLYLGSSGLSAFSEYSDIGVVEAYLSAIYSAGAGVFNLDPDLVNPAGGDGHLGSTSVCIDTGDDADGLGHDFEGGTRDASYDVGADEYGVGGEGGGEGEGEGEGEGGEYIS